MTRVWHQQWLRGSALGWSLILWLAVLAAAVPATATPVGAQPERISLAETVVLVDRSEPSYLLYGAKDLASYLTDVTGKPAAVSSSLHAALKSKSIIAIGKEMARALNVDLGPASDLGDEGFLIRSFYRDGSKVVIIAGLNPHGTNAGLATFMPMIHGERNAAYLDGPVDLRSKPSIAVRGIHLNGWPLKYPYAFRSWKEEDWKHFIDIAWAQRINLFYLWPFMEIIPVPMSGEDEAYLQEVKRVVDYAQNQRGMEVWIMQSANRIGVSDCGVRDPRFRTYWVMGECQKDMNPADPEQFANILKSFEALYKVVNNADGFCFIDSDPGGWPHSPLSDQTKIFNAARKLLDRYSAKGPKTKLVDWMWLGWGRVFDPTERNREENSVAFMTDTIRNFKANLPEPWELISGNAAFLKSSQKESVLNKTIYLQYGAIEMEPAFPATNLGQESIREVFDIAAKYPELKGVMGNNELMQLQFPRTFYFFNTAWDREYENRAEPEVLLDLAGELYPDHKELIAESFLGLRENDPEKIDATLARLERLVHGGNAGRPGPIGRFLFPDQLVVARNLQFQLEIRSARQSLLKVLEGKPSVDESAKLVENYFDKLLAWNQETGWDKMIDITIWRTPIYEQGKDLRQAMNQLKEILAQGKPYTSYAQLDGFFDTISKKLLQKYGRDSVMIGCIEPFKLAMIQN
ncbi:MAG: hypothetical protein ACRD23_08345 [Terriglobales bacterium]